MVGQGWGPNLLGGEEVVARFCLKCRAALLSGIDALEELRLGLVVKEQVEARAELAFSRVDPLHLKFGLLRVIANDLRGGASDATRCGWRSRRETGGGLETDVGRRPRDSTRVRRLRG